MKYIYTLLLLTVAFSPLFSQSLLQVSGLYNDAVYVGQTDRIYAITTSTDPENGNRICRIDPHNGTVEECYFVGSSPSVIAATDNGKFLFVGFSGENSVKRFNLSTNEVDLTFSTGGEGDFSGPFYPEEILPLPGSVTDVAVSLRNRCCIPRHEGVAVFRNGIQAANTTPDHTGSNSITYTDRDDLIIGYNNETTDFRLRSMSVTASGVTITSTYQFFSGFNSQIEYTDGRVYNTNGQFVNINNGLVSAGGAFSDNSFSFYRQGVEAVPAIGQVFFFGEGDDPGYRLEAFNETTLTSEKVWNFPDAQSEDVRELMLTDEQGERFAAVDENNRLYLIRICTSSFTEVPPPYEGFTSICQNDTLVAFAPAAARALGQILWSDGSIGDSVRITSGGRYAYAILDPSACPGPFSNEFSVFSAGPLPSAPEIEAPISTTICRDGSINLRVNAPSPSYDYIWSTGDTASNITISTAGNYTVLRRRVSSGCSSAPSSPVTISTSNLTAPPPPVLSPSLDLDTCTFGSVLFSTDRNAAEYYWSTSTGQNEVTDGTFNLSRSFFFSPRLSVWAISAEGCVSEPVTGTVRFFDRPETPTIQYNEANNTLASTFTDGRNFWYHNDVFEAATDGRFYAPLRNGFYSVRAEGEACLSEASDLVSVTLTSVQDIVAASEEITLAPNPAHDRVSLQFSAALGQKIGSRPLTIEVWSVAGQRLRRLDTGLTGLACTLDLPGLKGGLYLITVATEGAPLMRRMLAKI